MLAPSEKAEARSGWFWSWLGPVSTSSASFGVTPSFRMSIPSPAFAKIELPRMRLPSPAGAGFDPVSRMPSPELKAIVFPAPGAVPPIRLSEAPELSVIPAPTLARSRFPLRSVPIRLPWIVLPELST